MTLAVGISMPDRIQLVAESMISYENAARPSVWPGNLKLAALHRDVGLAYAGDVEHGIEAIRHLWTELGPEMSIAWIVSYLKAQTEAHDVAFILGVRAHGFPMIKVDHGRMFFGLDRYWIGDSNGATELQHQKENLEELKEGSDRFWGTGSPKEVLPPGWEELGMLSHSFLNLATTQAVTGVGGLCFYMECTNWGFAYNTHSANFAFSAQDYRFEIIGPLVRGVPVAGAYFPEGCLGFLYSPVEYDHPIKYPDVSHDEFNRAISSHVESVVAKSRRPDECFPREDEISQCEEPPALLRMPQVQG